MAQQLDPSQPLSKQRYETFCQLKSKNLTLAQAYQQSTPEGQKMPSDSVAKVSAFRWMARPEIAARVDYLERMRREAANVVVSELEQDIPESFDRGQIAALFAEVSDSLRHAYEVCRNSPEVPELKSMQVRAVLAEHTSRMSKFVEDHGEQETIAADGTDTSFVHRFHDCECSHG